MRWLLPVLLVGACRTERVERPVDASLPVPSAPQFTPPRALPSLPVQPQRVFEDDEPRVGSIVGLVLDSTGEPLPGATLVVRSGSWTAPAVVSGDNGSYVFDDLAPDDYLVTVYFADETQEHVVSVGDRPVELTPTIGLQVETQPTTIFFGCGGIQLEPTYLVDGIDTTGLTVE